MVGGGLALVGRWAQGQGLGQGPPAAGAVPRRASCCLSRPCNVRLCQAETPPPPWRCAAVDRAPKRHRRQPGAVAEPARVAVAGAKQRARHRQGRLCREPPALLAVRHVRQGRGTRRGCLPLRPFPLHPAPACLAWLPADSWLPAGAWLLVEAWLLVDAWLSSWLPGWEGAAAAGWRQLGLCPLQHSACSSAPSPPIHALTPQHVLTTYPPLPPAVMQINFKVTSKGAGDGASRWCGAGLSWCWPYLLYYAGYAAAVSAPPHHPTQLSLLHTSPFGHARSAETGTALPAARPPCPSVRALPLATAIAIAELPASPAAAPARPLPPEPGMIGAHPIS
jgi:hypothetical protein